MSQFRRFVCGALLAVACAGCKQGKGEVCQIDDDCEDGLRCIAGTMRCDKPGANTPDAAPEPDAGVLDAAVPDATPDYDAGPDASL